ncbi:protein vts1, variant [Exophiala oligosperma]|uniref:RNA-binding protein VTS1 n=2 Tax=Chaetothyriales TaxID=34395 RepID=A0A0D2ANZ3_9EURO|nr:protein vts1 [Exophiala oligosperma]XP_016261882.1 protein vts1, variant [Exophiala oligosperma]KAJ9617880.1 Flap-structured DNA-binding and RNA-binding protein [Knufia peltigerae]KIW41665.1 protein vts1 [Exophiala oligosperma]KIW41666.1 protein vts1, variant [Exophiala oligosperma]
MASNIIGNRNSTPEASKTSLRPPTSRTIGSSSAHNQPVRSSADMSFTSPLSARSIRPASEVLYNQQSQQGGLDDSSRLGEQWIQDIEQYETMLEEMAAATLDQDFKDELSAIEQWFRVLSEAERTAATYALIQQTTQMQQRFFAQVLNQMSKSHPISGVLSPANFGEKDPMSSRLSDAMSKLNVDDRRTSMGRPPVSPAGNKRNSGLDQSTIHAMFPDAVAAIQQQKAEYAQQTGNPPPSNRNSIVIGDRTSLVAPTISAPRENKTEALSWRQGGDSQQPPISRPKSSSGHHSQMPMGQFSQPPASASLRSPRPLGAPAGNIQSTTLTAPEPTEMPMLSPYNVGNQSWASMTNTPMVPNFNQTNTHNDMVANATAMKLAALSTVTNRIALDDAKKFRRARSNEPSPQSHPPLTPGLQSSGIPGINTIMVNDQGQILNAQQVAAIQAQQIAANQGRRSRPNSPGIPLQTPMGQSFASPQHNGFLAAYDGNPIMMGGGMPGLIPTIGSFGGGEGYLSDHSEIARGRSPRGRRGSSKPPEDPTDPGLLQDIPSWLRSLRLHKYTDNLKDLKWQELIELDDKGLEARGVNALGARNKMLKVFEQVKEAQSEGKL